MNRLPMVLTLALLNAACSGGVGDTQSAADTLTRAQKDSIVADLPVPGASGVGRALQARDAANARTEAHDTIG
jgi:fructose-specific phosphotransferase system component IIB